MAIQSSSSFVHSSPVIRDRRARRHRLAAVLVIAAIGSSALVLQNFHDEQRNVPGAAAFAYFPN